MAARSGILLSPCPMQLSWSLFGLSWLINMVIRLPSPFMVLHISYSFSVFREPVVLKLKCVLIQVVKQLHCFFWFVLFSNCKMIQVKKRSCHLSLFIHFVNLHESTVSSSYRSFVSRYEISPCLSVYFPIPPWPSYPFPIRIPSYLICLIYFLFLCTIVRQRRRRRK